MLMSRSSGCTRLDTPHWGVWSWGGVLKNMGGEHPPMGGVNNSLKLCTLVQHRSSWYSTWGFCFWWLAHYVNITAGTRGPTYNFRLTVNVLVNQLFSSKYMCLAQRKTNSLFSGCMHVCLSVNLSVFTRVALASAGISSMLSSFVCLSVCLSQVGVLLKQRNVGLHNAALYSGTAVFWRRKSRQNWNGVTPTEAPNAGGVR